MRALRQYFRVILRFSQMLTRSFFRDKVALFFTFVFPLIFLLVFGSLNRNNKGPSYDLAIINQSNSQFAKTFVEETKKSPVVKYKSNVTTLDQAKQQMSQGRLDTILLLPTGFGQPNSQHIPTGRAVVYYDPGNAQTGQSFAILLDGMLRKADEQLTQRQPLFGVEGKSTDTKGLQPFDFIFAGLIGFSILSLGFFGPTNSLPSMKKEGILRRLRTTPLRTSQFILANTLNYLIVGLVSVAVLFVAGMVVFKFHMQGDYVSFVVLAMMGIVMMFGFGLAIGGWAKNENQAAPLANILAFPMMFLSGTFFPRYLMPAWLEKASGFLPLTPLIDSFRHVLTEGQTLLKLGPELALIAAWTLLIYIIAFRVFRWE